MATSQILETVNLPSAEQDQRGFSSTGLASPNDGSPLFGHSLATNKLEDLEDIPNVKQVIMNIFEVFTLPHIFLPDSGHSSGIWWNPEELKMAQRTAKIAIPEIAYSSGILPFRDWD